MNKDAFAGKTVWLIGASTGIGRALALELSRRGARLALSARNQSALDALAAETGRSDHLALPLDVTDAAAVKTVFAAAQAQLGAVDSVILLSAAYTPMALRALDMPKVSEMITTNLAAAFYVIDTVLPAMRARGAGQIALCGSVAGYAGLPNGQPYSATKAAIMNLAQSLRAEEASQGIDVRLISPGFVKTPLTDKNDFAMPAMITPEDAARRLADGLAGRSFEIHFPRRFTYVMKALAGLPYALYFAAVRRFVPAKTGH
jgi:NAD(P)-dependent dehydrogenase (short-subunit alcohol dehydrogenase family)